MLFPKVPRESLGGLWTALGSRTLLVNQASHELFHRHSDPPGLTFEPGLVARIDIADGNASEASPQTNEACVAVV